MNLYASPIDLTKLIPTGGVSKFYYVSDTKLSGVYGLGAFQTLGQTGISPDINFYPNPGGGSYGSANTPHNYIESGQAFILSSTGTAGTLSFSETDKYTASIGNTTMLLGQGTGGKKSQLRTRLHSVSSNGTAELLDGVLIQYNEEYSDGY